MFILGALLPAVLGGIGSLIGGREQRSGQKEAAAKQMAFQERMSSTSYQRGVADMRKAGINPMLAFQQGGASSPGGAMPQIQDIVTPAVNSAMQMRRMTADLKQIQAQTFLTTQQSMKARSEAAAMTSAPQTGPMRGIPYFLTGKQAEFMKAPLQRRLLELGIPAATVRGSKLAALWQIYGRSIGGAAAGLVGLRFGRGFLQGRTAGFAKGIGQR